MAKTIFILGAGASHPYRFPLGGQLINEIADKIKNPDTINPVQVPTKKSLLYILLEKFRPHEIKNFRTQLLDSEFNSIDFFLLHNPNFIELGKACIGYVLLECESTSNYYEKLGGDWYRYFWNIIAAEDPKNFDFKIYTFNYERSLRNYLYKKINAAFSEDKDKQSKYLKSIPIYHLHGHLGSVKYGDIESIHNYANLEDIANHIKIISEVEQDSNFTNIQQDIISAEHVVFLGFGFHPENMKRLGFKDNKPSHRTMFYASVFGLEDSEIVTKFQNFISGFYNETDINTGPYLGYPEVINYEKEECLLFLRKNFQFENLFNFPD